MRKLCTEFWWRINHQCWGKGFHIFSIKNVNDLTAPWYLILYEPWRKLCACTIYYSIPGKCTFTCIKCSMLRLYPIQALFCRGMYCRSHPDPGPSLFGLVELLCRDYRALNYNNLGTPSICEIGIFWAHLINLASIKCFMKAF